MEERNYEQRREKLLELLNSRKLKALQQELEDMNEFDIAEFLTELGIMRLSADILAVRLAIYNGSNRDFDELQQIAEDCLAADRSGNTLERIEKDIAFHRKLALISGNRFLAETIDRLQKKNQLYFVETASSSDDIKDSLDQHFQIVRALKARNIDASIACAAEHLIPYYHIQKAIADTGLFSYL